MSLDEKLFSRLYEAVEAALRDAEQAGCDMQEAPVVIACLSARLAERRGQSPLHVFAAVSSAVAERINQTAEMPSVSARGAEIVEAPADDGQRNQRAPTTRGRSRR